MKGLLVFDNGPKLQKEHRSYNSLKNKYVFAFICSDVTNTSSYSSNLGKSTSSTSKSGGGGGGGGGGLGGTGGSKAEPSQPSASEPVDFSSNPALRSGH